MSNYTFYYTDPGTTLLKVSGVALFTFGFMAFDAVAGFVILILCVFLAVCYRRGIEVDFSKMRYRNFYYLGLKRQGKWQGLPDLQYISVFRAKYNSEEFEEDQDESETRILYEVNLVTEINQRINVAREHDAETAFKHARLFSNNLSLSIYDATTHEAKWIEAGDDEVIGE